MAISLSVADNADGTGAVATVSGSDAGSTNTVYYREAAGDAWVSGGSRTGNGTVTLSIATGTYFYYVTGTLVSSNPGVSAIVGPSPVTSGTTAVIKRSRDAIKADIQTIITAGSLPNFPGSSNVTACWKIDEKNKTFPHIFVLPSGAETNRGGTNARDDWDVPILVALVAKEHQDDENADIFLWRERLMRRLNNRRITTSVTENINVKVQPREIVEFVGQNYMYLVSSFLCFCWSRETRG